MEKDKVVRQRIQNAASAVIMFHISFKRQPKMEKRRCKQKQFFLEIAYVGFSVYDQK